MITEEKINSNFTLYQKRLAKDYSVDIEKLDKELPQLKDASFGISVDNGCAYPGSLIDKSIKLTSIAVKINTNVLGDDEVDKNSLVKVVTPILNITKNIWHQLSVLLIKL